MQNAEREPTNNDNQLEQVAKRLAGKAAVTNSGELDLLASIGGIRGIAEAVIPALVFLVGFVITTDVWISAAFAVGVALIASIVRLVQKQPALQALAGAVGVGICAAVALLQDSAGGYFVPGFYISAAYGLVFAISMLVKWPLLGLIFGWIRGEGVSWQKNVLRRRKYQLATFFMVLVFVARLVIQLPLYFSGEDVLLGIMRLVMGIPLYALVLWFGWLLSKPTKNPHMKQDPISPNNNAAGETGTETKL